MIRAQYLQGKNFHTRYDVHGPILVTIFRQKSRFLSSLLQRLQQFQNLNVIQYIVIKHLEPTLDEFTSYVCGLGNVFVYMCSICVSVCLSVRLSFQAGTDTETSFLVWRQILNISSLRLSTSVTGSRLRS